MYPPVLFGTSISISNTFLNIVCLGVLYSCLVYFWVFCIWALTVLTCTAYGGGSTISTNIAILLPASPLGAGLPITAPQSPSLRTAAVVVGSPLCWVLRQLQGQGLAMAMSRVLPSVRALGTLSPPPPTGRRPQVPAPQKGILKGVSLSACRV